MIQIKKAMPGDLPTIRDIAFKSWPATYGDILSKKQIQYMLELFYSEAALIQNTADGHQFLIATEDGSPLGFASFHHKYNNRQITRIPKIYILPEAQGKGIGRKLINEIVSIARENHSERLSLNVNRYNKAMEFYKHLGFEIVAEEDIRLDHGYLMEDYIMEKQLRIEN